MPIRESGTLTNGRTQYERLCDGCRHVENFVTERDPTVASEDSGWMKDGEYRWLCSKCCPKVNEHERTILSKAFDY
jgi:hypothetical protein